MEQPFQVLSTQPLLMIVVLGTARKRFQMSLIVLIIFIRRGGDELSPQGCRHRRTHSTDNRVLAVQRGPIPAFW
eukprot:393051-Amphidinium_carterae.1